MIRTSVSHDREFLYGPRGFTSIQEHDEEVIRRWNSVVGPEDIVYHLGDVMLNDNEHGMECLRRLNGRITIVPGNHDTPSRLALYKTLPNVTVLESNIEGMTAMSMQFKYKKFNFYVSHHPTMTSNLEKDPHLRMHLINLFGHTHQQKKFYNEMPFMFHVGMDSNNCTPISLDEAIELMKEETKKCIAMLDEPELMETVTSEPVSTKVVLPPPVNGGCEKCEWNRQCSGYWENVRCTNFHQEIKDGGYYG